MEVKQDATHIVRQHVAGQLANEIEFFRRHKPEWLPGQRGQFVLIGKQTFGGFYPTREAALRAGTTMFGLVTPFLIERIE